MKYIVIREDGSEIEASKFKLKDECSDEFSIFIEREMKENELEPKNVKPSYLQIAKKLGFSWEENGEIGHVSHDYKAQFIMEQLKAYSRDLVSKIGLPIYEVSGANMFDLSHPVIEAYAGLYGDRLYSFESGKNNVVMSYDASYPQFNLASKMVLSYKDLPFAHFSISDCYRHEQHGECRLLYRQRRFNMPDIHPYFKDINEAFEWYPKIEAQILAASDEINREFHISIRVAGNEIWDMHKDKIRKIAVDAKRDVLLIVEARMDSYWIINADYKIIDDIGQSREIACIQIDVGNAERLGINYVDIDGENKNPVIVHSAVPGGIERFLYMIFDRYEASFPIWLHPIQLRLIPVGMDHVSLAQELAEKYSSDAVRIDIDDRGHSVSKKIKIARNELIPHQIVLGDEELKGGGNIEQLEKIVREIENKSVDRPHRRLLIRNLCSMKI